MENSLEVPPKTQDRMIQQFTSYAAVFLEDPPKPSDPDPEEYEKWLEEQELLKQYRLLPNEVKKKISQLVSTINSSYSVH